MWIDDVKDLEKKSVDFRKWLVEITYETGGSYLAQALSVSDLMVAVFYHYLNYRPEEPDWPERDRFLLSPGHYALPLYAMLADLGYFDKEILFTFKKNGSPAELVTHRGTLPGVEVSGGSLGQGLSLGVGMALHAKLRGKKHRVVVMMSDGELDEGQVWEAAMSAAHYKLGNMLALVDANGFQVDGATEEVMNTEPLPEKFKAFRWLVKEVDGHNMEEIVAALEEFSKPREMPAIIIGRTVRGKGIPFMERNKAFHYTRMDKTMAEKAEEALSAAWDAV